MNVAVGIDIGGTSVTVALVDRQGGVVCSERIPVKSIGTIDLFTQILTDCIEKLRTSHQIELIGIGIGSPGANIHRGVIEKTANLPWENVPVVEILRLRFQVPVFLTNDANLFALGEKAFGGASALEDFVVVTLGTGVGAGIYCGGALLLGRDGLGGEIGHVIIEKDGRSCGCGRRGCLERYVSAGGLVQTAREMLDSDSEPSLLHVLPADEMDAGLISEAAASGDKVALEIFNYTGELLGKSLADLVTYLNPEAIFLGGGLAQAGPVLFEPTIRSFEAHLLGIYSRPIPIMPCAIPGDQAGVIGAAALVWSHLTPSEQIETSAIKIK